MKWMNPTGGKVRGSDRYGAGHYNAPRTSHKNGKIIQRKHKGVDFEGKHGQIVIAVCSGIIYRIGYPYADNLGYRYIGIKTPEGYTVRQMYVKPDGLHDVGTEVTVGDNIGILQSLEPRYPGITNHCHVDIKDADGNWVNPEGLIPIPEIEDEH